MPVIVLPTPNFSTNHSQEHFQEEDLTYPPPRTESWNNAADKYKKERETEKNAPKL